MTTKKSSWQGTFCIEVKPMPAVLVIFGAAGDLANRKLFPALAALECKNLLPENTRVLGCVRADTTDDAFRAALAGRLQSSCRDSFLEHVGAVSGDYSGDALYERLAERLREPGTAELAHIFYFATGPELFGTLAGQLHKHGLLDDAPHDMRRIVIEKPFGYGEEDARELDDSLHRCLAESQIYRVDHYLGKETVQNILMMRFANMIFEPVWNRACIDHVQITVAESIGVEHRAKYYERSGCLRDMFQNHMLELLSLVAMEMPGSFTADDVRSEKLKLVRSIRPLCAGDFARGQYASYRSEPFVASDSSVETFVAARMMIDNWRWKDVPFYLRSGKRLAVRKSEIAIAFKRVPHSIFYPIRDEDLAPNLLLLKIQPDEGLELVVQAKRPGPKLCMGDLSLHFNYAELEEARSFEAYERLWLDIMLGDQTLFVRGDQIAESWRLYHEVTDAWSKSTDAVELYDDGSQGPLAAEKLIGRDRRFWRTLEL